MMMALSFGFFFIYRIWSNMMIQSASNRFVDDYRIFINVFYVIDLIDEIKSNSNRIFFLFIEPIPFSSSHWQNKMSDQSSCWMCSGGGGGFFSEEKNCRFCFYHSFAQFNLIWWLMIGWLVEIQGKKKKNLYIHTISYATECLLVLVRIEWIDQNNENNNNIHPSIRPRY